MNSTAKDIVTMLEAEAPLGLIKGTNLFYARMGNTPSDCVVVYDTPSSTPLLTYKKNTSSYHYPGVSVMVRNTTYDGAYALMTLIQEYLHAESNVTVGTTYYAIIKAVNDPQILHYDENDRPILFINFEIQRKEV